MVMGQWVRFIPGNPKTYPELPHSDWSFTSIPIIGAIQADEGNKRVLPLWYTRKLDKSGQRREYFRDENDTEYDRQITYWRYYPAYPEGDQVLYDDQSDD